MIVPPVNVWVKKRGQGISQIIKGSKISTFILITIILITIDTSPGEVVQVGRAFVLSRANVIDLKLKSRIKIGSLTILATVVGASANPLSYSLANGTHLR